MDHLDHRGEHVPVVPRIAAGARGEQEQRRSQALASPADDVFGDLADERDLGAKPLAQDRVHASEVGADRGFQEVEQHGGGRERRAAKVREGRTPAPGAL